MIEHKVKIIDIINETEDVKTYMLEKPKDLIWNAASHSLFGLDCMNGEEVKEYTLFRYMSIMTLPEEDKIGFSTKIPGSLSPFKKELSNLGIGDEIGIFRIGSVLDLKREDKPIILLSMGVGAATMRPLIHRFREDSSNIPYMIQANVNSTGEFLYQEELNSFESETFANHWLSSRQEFYQLLNQLVEIEGAYFYLVGSDDFMKELIIRLKSLKVAPENIIMDRLEEFAHSYYGL